MGSPDEFRENAMYILFRSYQRPVEEVDGVIVVLSYTEYRIVQRAVEWVQHLGTVPIPTIRLARGGDAPTKSFTTMKKVLHYLSGFCEGTSGFPNFENGLGQCLPVDLPPVETPVGVESMLDLTERALKELQV